MQKVNLNYSIPSSLLLQYTDINKNTLIKNIIKAENKFDPKYKTELCKKFQNTGQCPYGYKCRFAHGEEELISKHKGKNYKKRPCKTFFEKGFCPYGSRCNFQHNEKSFFDINFSFYYFQLFLLAKYFNHSATNFLHSIGSKLINDRLPVFKSITKNLSNDYKKENKVENLFESSKDDLIQINIERKYSQSTFSNTSYEEDKKINIIINENISGNF